MGQLFARTSLKKLDQSQKIQDCWHLCTRLGHDMNNRFFSKQLTLTLVSARAPMWRCIVNVEPDYEKAVSFQQSDILKSLAH